MVIEMRKVFTFEAVLPEKGHSGNFWSDVNIPYLN